VPHLARLKTNALLMRFVRRVAALRITAASTIRRMPLLLKGLQLAVSVAFLAPAAVLFFQYATRMFHDSGTGLDLSDEGLYLVAASQGGTHETYLGTWGSLTHIIFAAAGSDVGTFRFVGFVLLSVSGAALSLATFDALLSSRSRAPNFRPRSIPRWQYAAAAIIGATTLPVYYFSFLLTPGYNWTNLVGTTITLAVVIFLLGRPLITRWLEWSLWVVVGFCILVTLISRPATAIALTMAVTFVLAARVLQSSRGSRPFAFVMLARAMGAAALGAALFFVTVSSPQAILVSWERLAYWSSRTPNESVSGFVTGGWQALLALARLAGHEAAPYLVVVAIPLFLALGMRLKPNVFRVRALVIVCEFGYLVLFGTMVVNLRRDGVFLGGPSGWQALPTTAAVWLFVSGGIWISSRVLTYASGGELLVGSRLASGWTVVAVSALIVGAMYAYGFTSTNGIVEEAALSSGLALMLASLIVIVSMHWQPARSIALIALPLVLVLALGWIANDGASEPYRTGGVYQDTASVSLPAGGGTLLVTPEERTFIDGLQQAAARAGFRRGTPVFDLTEGGWVFTPGLVFLLGGLGPSTLMLPVAPAPLSVVRWAIDLQSTWFRDHAWIAVGTQGITLRDAAEFVADRTPSRYTLVYSGRWGELGETVSLYRPRP
jgi:hypothetical protein